MNPAVSLYRAGNFFYRRRIRIVAHMLTWLNRLIFSTYIPSGATIGKKFKAGYWGLGIVIHARTIIGDNCLVGQNVTIGRNLGEPGVPKLGNDVYVGAGSVVFGDVTIGDNVIIGSNSVVNKNIPANCTVVGNPFRIIAENRSVRYYELDAKDA
jgi:serine O-acetyltransferase